MKPRRKHEDSETLTSLVDRLVVQAVEQGVNSEKIAAALDNATIESANIVVAELRRTASKMLRQHAKLSKGFEQRLRTRWSRALDLYECVTTSCLEVGDEFNREHAPTVQETGDMKFEALTLLHARACMVASEIHALIRTGHAAGAQARWRTLHEIAVISFILGASEAEISERFLLHSNVERFKDAERYQLYCEELGYEPFSDEEMSEFRAAKETAVGRFGSGYQKPWGWAKPLVPSGQQPNFSLLEPLAGVEHLRPWVQLSHHTIHSGATGALHVRDLYGRGRILLVGPSNSGLADPASSALISLLQATTAYLLYGSTSGPTPERLIALKAIGMLLDDAMDSFIGIQADIDSEEEHLEATSNS